MDVEYKTTFDDYAVFCHHTRRRSWPVFCIRIFMYLLCPSFFVLSAIGELLQHGRTDRSLFATTLAMALACPALYWILTRLAQKALLHTLGKKRAKGCIGKTRLVLNDDWLTEVTEAGTSAFMWNQLRRIDDLGNYLFIYVTPRAAAIVPKHGFESAEEYERLKAYAKQCFAKQRR